MTRPDEPDSSDEVTSNSFVGVSRGPQSLGICMLVIGSSPSGDDRPWISGLQHGDGVQQHGSV